MILFDFKCGECLNIYEVFYREDTVLVCPKCEATENQEKQLSYAHGYATDDDSPKTEKDLRNYFGNGQYAPGYKKD